MQESEFTDYEIEEFKRCINMNDHYFENYSIYGPANPLRQNICDEEDEKICEHSPTGICHMFTCMCHEENADYVKDNDWFNGYCNFCNEEIKSKVTAWRIPHKNGGFCGCYCSKEHMESILIDGEDEDYIILVKIMDAVRGKFPVVNLQKSVNELKDLEEYEENDF